jgi:hypothetical protein
MAPLPHPPRGKGRNRSLPLVGRVGERGPSAVPRSRNDPSFPSKIKLRSNHLFRSFFVIRIQKERLSIEFVDEITIVRLLDKEIHQVFCEADDAEAVSKQIATLVRSARPRYLLLDLSEVEFMASFMQAFLIELQK